MLPLSLRALLQVIVVDEIGSKTEVAAVKDIAQRGWQPWALPTVCA